MKKRILIADDDAAILDATSMMLEDEGYHVETTTNGQTVHDIKKDFPDLILLDIWMSGQDGREICKHLKTQNATKNIPIMLISATRDVADIAHDAGADDFLAKPFDIDVLLEKVKKYTTK